MNNTILREAILPRLDGIGRNIKRLKELGVLGSAEFTQGDNYDLAQHHLRLALEGVFHISSHILSRIPGGRVGEYKDIARKMGEFSIVPREFADKPMVAMAGMRNLLVHNYSDLEPRKVYEIITDHLDDIQTFLSHIKTVVKSPEKFGLQIA